MDALDKISSSAMLNATGYVRAFSQAQAIGSLDSDHHVDSVSVQAAVIEQYKLQLSSPKIHISVLS